MSSTQSTSRPIRPLARDLVRCARQAAWVMTRAVDLPSADLLRAAAKRTMGRMDADKLYRHRQKPGVLVRLLYLAYDPQTLEQLVVYEYDGVGWACTVEEFGERYGPSTEAAPCSE